MLPITPPRVYTRRGGRVSFAPTLSPVTEDVELPADFLNNASAVRRSARLSGMLAGPGLPMEPEAMDAERVDFVCQVREALEATAGDDKDVIYAIYLEEEDPKTLLEVFASPNREAWLEAMQEELQALEKNGTWEVCQLLAGRRATKRYSG